MNARILILLVVVTLLALGGALVLLDEGGGTAGAGTATVGDLTGDEGPPPEILAPTAGPDDRLAGLTPDEGPREGLVTSASGAGMVSGRVVGRGGQARPDAELIVYRTLDGDLRGRHQAVAMPFPVDAEGRFLLPGLPLDTVLLLEAKAPGAAPAHAELAPLAAGETRDVGELVVQSGIRLVGQVLNADRQPLQGALVTVTDVALAGPEGGDGQEVARAETDAEGRYAISDLAQRQFKIQAQAEGHGAMTSVLAFVLGGAGPEWTQDFVLQPADHVLAGTVEDASGNGLPGVSLRFVQRTPGAGGAYYNVTALSDQAGAFAITAVPAGLYEVTVSAAEWYVDGPVRLEAGTVDHRIRMHPALVVTGTLSTSHGEPPSRFSVSVRPDGRTGARLLPGAPTSLDVVAADPPGRFRFGGLRPGAYRFTVTAPGYAPSTSQDVVMGSGQLGAEVVIPLRMGARLVGRVTDPLGNPEGLEGTRVELRDADYDPGLAIESAFPTPPLPGLVARTDLEGRFVMEHVPVGTYVVSARPEAQPAVHLGDVPLYEGETTDVGTLVVERGGSLGGTVVGQDGRPVAGATVRISGDGYHASLKTQIDGSFRQAALRSGQYELSASPPGLFEALRLSAEGRALVRPGEETSVELRLSEQRLDQR